VDCAPLSLPHHRARLPTSPEEDDDDPLASTEEGFEALFDGDGEEARGAPHVGTANAGHASNKNAPALTDDVATPASPDTTVPAVREASSVANRIIMSTLQAQLREAECAYAEASGSLIAARAEAVTATRRAAELEAEAEINQNDTTKLAAELECISNALDTAQTQLRMSQTSESTLQSDLTSARAAVDAAKVDVLGERAATVALQAERDAERITVANDRAVAITTATEGLDEQSKLDLVSAKAELEKIWQDRLDAAVVRPTEPGTCYSLRLKRLLTASCVPGLMN
jgi:hypothetical protein